MILPHIVKEQRAQFEEIYRDYGRTLAYEHASFAEISMMLAVHPDLADMARAEEGRTGEIFYPPEHH